MADGAVLIAVGIVDGLDTAAGGRIILGGRHLQLPVIWQGADALDQALPVGPGADDGRPVIVLERAGNDFGRGGRAGIHQHDDGQFRVQGRPDRLVFGLRHRRTAFRAHYQTPLRHKERDHLDRLGQQPATISTQVQAKALHPLLLEGDAAVPDPLGHAVRKLRHQDISRRVIDHSDKFDRRQDDAFPQHGHLDDIPGFPALPSTQFLHLELDRRARLAAHLLGTFRRLEPVGAEPVDGQDFIPAAQSGAGGRRVFVGLVDDDIPVQVLLVDDGADAAIGIGEHHLESLLLLLRHIDGIGVQRLEHRVHGGPLDAADLERIDIGTAEFLENGVMDFHPFAEGEVFRLGGSAPHQEAAQNKDGQKFFHSKMLFDASKAGVSTPRKRRTLWKTWCWPTAGSFFNFSAESDVHTRKGISICSFGAMDIGTPCI